MDRFEQAIQTLTEKFDALAGRFDGLNGKFDALASDFNQLGIAMKAEVKELRGDMIKGFDGVNGRLSKAGAALAGE